MNAPQMTDRLVSGYFNAMPGQAYMKDLDGKYLYVNQQFAAVQRIPCGDLAHENYTDDDFYNEAEAEQHRNEDRTVVQTDSQLTTFTLASGLVMKFPIKNQEGTTIAVGGLIQPSLTTGANENAASSKETNACAPEATPLPERSARLMPKSHSPKGVKRSLEQEEGKEDFKAMESSLSDPPVRSGQPASNQLPQNDDQDSLSQIMLNRPDLLPHGDKKLFTNMPMGATYNEIVTDDNGKPIDYRFLAINPAFAQLTGLKPSETIGKRVTEVLPNLSTDPTLLSSEQGGWIAQFGKVALEGDTWRFDRKWCRGVQKWVGGIAYRPSGQNRRFVSLFLDVSEGVQAEEALRESEERHRNLFESTTQGVVYQGASGNIIAANPSSERILGLTVDQMMGRTSVDPRWKSTKEDGSDFPGNEHPAMVALSTGKPVTGVLMGVFHPNKERHHWIIIDAIPRFKPGEDKPYQVYTTFTDLTETKDYERRLVKEKARAEMADKLKSAFLANMSHEIRTPLNGIIGHIDLALSNGLSEEQRQENLDGLNVARQSGDLLISIIQDILDLSKIEAGQMAIKNDENFRLRDLVGQVASLGQTMINQRKKTIDFGHRVDGEIADCICGDPFRLQQVLNNLISNAVKFTDKGKVELTIALVDNQMLQFTVRDTGKGVPKDHLESIFEPFRQVEIGDTRKHGGTGLGLTISKKLVEMMGGELSVASDVEGPNKGSSFGFTFPYKRHSAPGEATQESSNASVCKPAINAKPKIPMPKGSSVVERKILVAEDETVSRRLVKRMLEISGYEVILAEDGLQAVECFKAHNDIALILMDVQMPNCDGLEATSLIREIESANPDRPVTPIIALSAGAMKGDNERGLAVGMTAYLTKPVNFKLLKETLKHHLGK